MKSVAHSTRRFAISLVCGLAAWAGVGTSRAADGTWTRSSDGSWADTGNWNGGTVASGAGSTAYFNNGTSLTVSQNVPGLTLGSLYFASANYGLTGNAITLDNSGSPSQVTVGSGTADGTMAYIGVPLNGTAGLTKVGPGSLNLTAADPGALDGRVTVSSGALYSSATNGAPFGAGSFYLNGGTLIAAPSGSGAVVTLAAASGAAANTFAYGLGPSTLLLTNGANASLTLTLGNAGAAAESVLVRTNGGALVIAPSGGTAATNLGVTERLLVNGGVATLNGMVGASIIGRANDGRGSGDFLTYGANGFQVAAYTEGVGGGASSIANVSTATSTDSAQVYALRVQGGNTLTINSGQTLRVGDGTHPAGVIVNASSATPGVITGGTLDFGTSEGIIYYSYRDDYWSQNRISSAITGQNGLTLAAIAPDAEILLNASSYSYTGGTRILGGRAQFQNTSLLIGGDITVMGHGTWGGQLWVSGVSTVTNTLHLSGLSGHQEDFRFGALRIDGNGTVFSGPVELLDDARVSMVGSGNQATFNGPIYGNAALEVGGNYSDIGTVALGGANTYTGGTRINMGKLQLNTGGTLGTGPVQNVATLAFNSSDALNVANTIGGWGRLIQQGSGTLKLSGVSSYAGLLTLNGAFDLGGQSKAFGALSGNTSGRVVNPAGPSATLTVGSANTNTKFSGRIEDSVSLAKAGSGILTLFGTNSYSGATTVSGGVLKLGSGPALVSGLSYRLDASDATTVTRSGDLVTAWADASGGNVAFYQGTSGQQPTYVANSINGLATVRFGDSGRNRMVANSAVTVQTVFIVCRMTSFGGLDGIWGQAGADSGIRAKSITEWQSGSNGGNVNDFTGTGAMYINGVAATTFDYQQPHILTAVASSSSPWTTAIGDYWGSDNPDLYRYFRGDIGELLVYDHVLTDAERQSVVDYLSHKWLGGASGALANVLPSTTALTVGSGASVDLNGVNQSVGALSGAGNVVNGVTSTCALTVGGDNSDSVFDGSILGSVTLTKLGSGTLTLYGTNSFSGATVVQSGTLKLGGWPVTSGVSYHLDATEASTLTLSGSKVTAWADASGNGVSFSQGDSGQQPEYEASAINGLPAIRFSDAGRNRMVANQDSTVQTVFIVCRMTSFGGLDGVWGQAGNDKGVRAKSISEWQDDVNGGNGDDYSYGGDMYINGVSGTTFTSYQPHILTAVAASSKVWTTAIGDYWGSGTYYRYFRGEIGEVLVYDRVLSTSERQAVVDYLSHKWLGTAEVASRLPASSDITVAAGATLDLNGQVQTLATLTGSGSVIGDVAVSGTTSPAGANTVGTLSMQGAPALSGNLLIDVRLDGSCDKLAVTGGLDVSSLALVVADTDQLANTVYTIASCTGNLTGSFTGTNLPEKKWLVRYVRTAGAGKIQLVPVCGTMVLIR